MTQEYLDTEPLEIYVEVKKTFVAISNSPTSIETGVKKNMAATVSLSAPIIEIQMESAFMSDARYVHTQMVPSVLWTVIHNTNKRPSVTVVDSTDHVVVGDVNYIDSNRLTISFAYPFSGKAYIN